MTVSAKIIKDSVSLETGYRITTMELRYPRFIHAEELTHRALSILPGCDDSYFVTIPDGLMYDKNLSRNASSSRAIPVKKMIAELRRDPALPEMWVMDESGMQGFTRATEAEAALARSMSLELMELAIQTAESWAEMKFHKQHINRVLEPWMHIKVVVTATNWANFFHLRLDKMADPTMQALARAVRGAMDDSLPTMLDRGQWHLPYYDSDESVFRVGEVNRARLISAARCARVSYNNFEGKLSTEEEDLKLCEKLMGSGTLHASPFEHQATPDWILQSDVYANDKEWGNFTGWRQYRKMLPAECVPEVPYYDHLFGR